MVKQNKSNEIKKLDFGTVYKFQLSEIICIFGISIALAARRQFAANGPALFAKWCNAANKDERCSKNADYF